MICPICKKKIEHGTGRAFAWEHTAGEGPRRVCAHHECVEKLPKEFHYNASKNISVRSRIADAIGRTGDDDNT